MKLGILGGSFNPVHTGHVGLARRAIAELKLDRLLVIPAFVSPFKTASVPDADRVSAVRAAFADVAEAVVDEREIQRGGVSFAIDTVREIATENPGAELFFVIGEDSLARLDEWKDIAELRKLCRFVAFPRTAESSTEIRERRQRGDNAKEWSPWTAQ